MLSAFNFEMRVHQMYSSWCVCQEINNWQGTVSISRKHVDRKGHGTKITIKKDDNGRSFSYFNT